ncbi:M23/M56 family metallopeptidase [Pleionea litopenaei]|uniref:M23/M56 family metallopeptidase n=1 Tax=Pleionea litopenaei TaxID=3070815 RepID=A0AA51X6K7_9GAMM|nr:M23/M56 family metallopeptidase [Pleionea sp. HL-JVS1]WMS87233.1 M23/M56 family metallopeptidase [Pleionea sp. HL-JVS1]
MIDLTSFINGFTFVSIYSIVVTVIVYYASTLLSKRLDWLQRWESYWLTLFLCCVAIPILEWMPVLDSTIKSSLLADLYFGALDHGAARPAISDSSISTAFEWSMTLKWSWFALCTIGILYSLTRLVLRIIAVNKMCRMARTIDDYSTRVYSKNIELIKRLAKRYSIRVLVSGQTHSPFIVQWRKPALVLTEYALETLSETELKLLVRHELTHVKRRDGLTCILTQTFLCLFWFNPFLRSIDSSLNWAIESSCDEAVLIKKKNLRRIYAQAMLKILRGSATDDANQVVAAFSSKSHRSITMRIKYIMKPSEVQVNRLLKSLGLTAFALSFSSITYAFYPVKTTDSSGDKVVMENPVKAAKVSSHFGASNKFHKFHKGMDLPAKMHSPVVAAGKGVVVTATTELEKAKNYGTIIIIDHGSETQTVYSHLDSMNVSEGDVVEKGHLIGRVGVTGKTTGPHVHFEVRKGGKPVDPKTYIEFKK